MTRSDTAPLSAGLLSGMQRAARESGDRLLASFPVRPAPRSLEGITTAVAYNESVSEAGLRETLGSVRPNARWADDERDTATVLDGEWWVVDSVEGNVNHIHGTDDWGVSITLLRDGSPIATVFRQPSVDRTYVALSGAGAYLNGQRLSVSRKRDLLAALAMTGQAEPGQAETYQSIGASVTAMLRSALLVQVSVPSTVPLLRVAAGVGDVFWQYSPVLAGIASGVLLTTEAGGTVSTIKGEPWTPDAPDVLVTNGLLHLAALTALSSTPSPIHA